MKKGLVLEGGAMRGMFTCGVLDVLMEEGIEFDGAVGTSAGAAFGCNYKSKQPRRAIRYNLRFAGNKRYGSFASLLKTGNYFGKEFAYDLLPNKLDIFDAETYKNNPMEFYICATDVEKGEPVYFESKTGDKRDIEWMRASSSMPLFSEIVEVDGYKLLDGGVTDSIPLEFLESKGYEKNLVILTQPEFFVKKPNPFMPVMKIVYKDYPNMLTAMEYRHLDYNRCVKYIREREKKGLAYVIAPAKTLPLSRIEKDPKKLLAVYKMGRRTAKKQLNLIKDFLED